LSTNGVEDEAELSEMSARSVEPRVSERPPAAFIFRPRLPLAQGPAAAREAAEDTFGT
jgi:hypothetical protein